MACEYPSVFSVSLAGISGTMEPRGIFSMAVPAEVLAAALAEDGSRRSRPGAVPDYCFTVDGRRMLYDVKRISFCPSRIRVVSCMCVPCVSRLPGVFLPVPVNSDRVNEQSTDRNMIQVELHPSSRGASQAWTHCMQNRKTERVEHRLRSNGKLVSRSCDFM